MFSRSRRMASREELKHRDAAHKGPVSTSSGGNVDHIHAVDQHRRLRFLVSFSIYRFRFDAFSTVHTNTICMRFDPLAMKTLSILVCTEFLSASKCMLSQTKRH